MNLVREFIAKTKQSIVQERIVQFLNLSGYRQNETNSLVYKRGFSSLGTMFAFSPKNWGVEATFHTTALDDENTKVEISLYIDTTGQWITDKERAFWTKELESFEAAICQGSIDISTSTDIANSSETQNWLSMIVIWMSMILFTSCFTLVAFAFTRSFAMALLFSSIGFIFGLLVGLGITKIWLNYKIGGKW
jgi:hypothetical protein